MQLIMIWNKPPLSKEENREKKELTEFDYLTGVNDESRMGGLRFKYKNSAAYISENDLYNVPPLESIRKLEEASLYFEKEEFLFLISIFQL